MSRNITIALLFVCIGGSAARADSIILAEFFGGGGYGEYPGYYVPPEDRWVQCTLQWGASPSSVVFGADLYWYEPGEHIFPDPNTPPEDWALFVAGITDGSSDPMRVCCGSSIGGTLLPGSDPDLSGYQIDYLRLQVLDITWDWEPPGISFGCEAKWQIWGVPEPASLLLLILGAGLAARPRR